MFDAMSIFVYNILNLFKNRKNIFFKLSILGYIVIS
jgi:hypothetical protein